MLPNTQPPEKLDRSDGSVLAVNSIFYTIQGEGIFAGYPSVFVRLAGCNLQCPMCDTEYTQRTSMSVEKILSEVGNKHIHSGDTKLIVITGGEPFRQNINNLINLLLEHNYVVQIETNGSLFRPLTNFGHINLLIMCSPKTGNVNKKLAEHIDGYKYVASAKSLIGSEDGLPLFALEHPNNGILARPPANFDGIVYLQPVDEQDNKKNAENLQCVVKSCMKYGHVLCIQLHKIIGVD